MGSKIVLRPVEEILHNKNVETNHWFNTLLFSVLALISMKPSGHGLLTRSDRRKNHDQTISILCQLL